jgi:glyoxylate utilization-related uncharacterized protein
LFNLLWAVECAVCLLGTAAVLPARGDGPMSQKEEAEMVGEVLERLESETARAREVMATELESEIREARYRGMHKIFRVALSFVLLLIGAALPFVETHVMEHALILLQGQGVYRLDDDWYPIQEGDVIWMGPFCPQWFCAIGKTISTYLYYKDIHRDWLEDEV